MDQPQLIQFPLNRTVRRPKQPREWKLVSLRECPSPESMQLCDTPEKAFEYWNMHISQHPYFNPEAECLFVLLLNTRRRVKGHHLVSIGTLDTVVIHPREVFRVAILAAASAIVCMHNHPSGEAMPSDPDIAATRQLARAGQLLRIELLDHVIVGLNQFVSLRALGYIDV